MLNHNRHPGVQNSSLFSQTLRLGRWRSPKKSCARTARFFLLAFEQRKRPGLRLRSRTETSPNRGSQVFFFLQDLAKVLNVLIFLWIVLVNSLISGNYLSVPGILDENLPNLFDCRSFFTKACKSDRSRQELSDSYSNEIQ